MDELLECVSKGRLPFPESFEYNNDPIDRLGRVSNAILHCPNFQTQLAPPPSGSWRRCWLDAFRNRWPFDEELATLHLAALESRTFAGLRASGVTSEQKARMLGFLHSLGPPVLESHEHDGFQRWLPGISDSQNWAARVLAEGSAQTQNSSRQEVLFPGVWAESNPGLLRARVTRLSRPATPGEPRLLLAAWSCYLIHKPDIIKLVSAFNRIAEEYLGNGCFLLELLGLHEGVEDHETWLRLMNLSPQGFLVTGGSLGLAVLLAAWAAHTHPEILPLIATGELVNGGIGPVDDIAAKSRVVSEYLMMKEQHRHTFLVPTENYEEIIATLTSKFPNRIEKVQPEVSVLFTKTERLTDGCQGYREFLDALKEDWALQGATCSEDVDQFACYKPSDRAELNDIATELLSPGTGTNWAMALPFGCEPHLAMRYLLRRLIRPAGPGVRIPLPFLLSDTARGDTPTERLAWRIERGLASVGKDLIAAQTLRNLVGTFGDWLVLIAHGKASKNLERQDIEVANWNQVRDDLASLPTRQQPRLLLLASDWHHLDRLCPENGPMQRLASQRTGPEVAERSGV